MATRRRIAALALGAAAGLGLLSVPANAHADMIGAGMIGQLVEGGVTCLPVIDGTGPHRVIVQPPIMSAHGAWKQPDGSPPVVVVGGSSTSGPGAGMHSQRVSYQASLYTWNGSGWVWDQSGQVVHGYTGTQAQVPDWDLNGQEWSTWFEVAGGDRYYAVHYTFRWVADNLSPEPGVVSGWATDYEDGRSSWCHMP